MLLQAVENLWGKYSVSNRALDSDRAKAFKALDDYLVGLGYCEVSL